MRNYTTMVSLGLALAIAAGCGEKDPVRVYQAPKEAPGAGHGKTGTGTGIRPADTKGEDPRWVVPVGWTKLEDQQMRFATFQVDPADSKLNVVVYAFGPESGQLLANVNRWEGQIGLPPSPAADLSKVVTHLKSNGLEIDSVDLNAPPAAGETEGQRMLAAIIPAGGRIWFLKFVGGSAGVAAHKAEYDAFLKSISFPKGAAVEKPPAAEGDVKMKTYSTPPGWTLEPEPKPMRVATFHVVAGGLEGEVIISTLPSQSGSALANINRWRSQVGLGSISDAKSQKQVTVKLGEVEGVRMDFVGAAAGGQPAKSLLVVQATKGTSLWYFKLSGPSQLVVEQEKVFEMFVKSIQFEPATE
ncbi:MAG: hypothetical protein K8T20_10970 [Planctomycetes bacterium]|nr:hypothetical protein [Planctomycetota bacterium]